MAFGDRGVMEGMLQKIRLLVYNIFASTLAVRGIVTDKESLTDDISEEKVKEAEYKRVI